MRRLLLFFLIFSHFVFSQERITNSSRFDYKEIDYSPDANYYLVTTTKDILIFSADDNSLIETIKTGINIEFAKFDLKNQILVAGYNGKGSELLKCSFPNVGNQLIYKGNDRITAFGKYDKYEFAIIGTRNGDIIEIDLKTSQHKTIHNTPVRINCIEVDQSRIFVGLNDGSLLSNNSDKFEKVKVRDSPIEKIISTYDNTKVFLGFESGHLTKLENFDSLVITHLDPVLSSSITDLSMSPDDKIIAASAIDGEILLYNFVQQKVLKKYTENKKKDLNSIDFIPTGENLISVSYGDRSFLLYDLKPFGIKPYYRLRNEDDKTAPLIYLSNPPKLTNDRITYSGTYIQLEGTVVDESGVNSVIINNINTKIRENGNFTLYLPLAMGDNYISMEVKDINGNAALKKFVIERKNLDGEKYDPIAARNFLLIIGINNYTKWPTLFNAVKDAEDVANTLIGMYNFGYSDVKMIVNEEATLNNIYDQLRSYIELISPQDNLMIYYSGHGHYDELLNEGYWIPYNANVNSPAEYMSNSNLLKILNNIRSQHTFLVVDACFSGSLFAQKSRGYVENVESYKSRWGLASGRLETVSDGAYGQNSPFATKFLDFLKSNTKTEIPVSEIVQYVKINVANESDQTPIGNPLQNLGDQGGEFIFRKKN